MHTRSPHWNKKPGAGTQRRGTASPGIADRAGGGGCCSYGGLDRFGRPVGRGVEVRAQLAPRDPMRRGKLELERELLAAFTVAVGDLRQVADDRAGLGGEVALAGGVECIPIREEFHVPDNSNLLLPSQ